MFEKIRSVLSSKNRRKPKHTNEEIFSQLKGMLPEDEFLACMKNNQDWKYKLKMFQTLLTRTSPVFEVIEEGELRYENAFRSVVIKGKGRDHIRLTTSHYNGAYTLVAHVHSKKNKTSTTQVKIF